MKECDDNEKSKDQNLLMDILLQKIDEKAETKIDNSWVREIEEKLKDSCIK